MSNALASWRLKSAGSRTYFFDLKETKTNNTYLQVTESKPKGNDQDGLFLGVQSIPESWMGKLENRDYIEKLALKLTDAINDLHN